MVQASIFTLFRENKNTDIFLSGTLLSMKAASNYDIECGKCASFSSDEGMRVTPRTRNLRHIAEQWAREATPRGQMSKTYMFQSLIPTLLPALIELIRRVELRDHHIPSKNRDGRPEDTINSVFEKLEMKVNDINKYISYDLSTRIDTPGALFQTMT